jgi:hypothetical protein
VIARRRLLALLPAAVLASAARAQDVGGLVSRGAQWQALPAPSTLGPAAGPFLVALPLVAAGGAPASVAFYGRSGGQRAGPALSFAYGVDALEYEVQVAGAAGASYREEWRLDGVRQPQLDTASSVPSDPALLTNAIQYSGGGPLPRGSYAVRILVAGFLAAEVAVTIV